MDELEVNLLDLLTSTEDTCERLAHEVQVLARCHTPMELTTVCCYMLHQIQHGCGMPVEHMISDITVLLRALDRICPTGASGTTEE